ncbi:catalytics isoform X2 [Wolffia australiana]
MAESSSTSAPPPYRYTNRLSAEHSPYLLQHAHNPVDWYPWGEEAFKAARERDVPIFLSIGYSTCHWCHVMEVESFENEEVAKILNDAFVSIKVDREERPDVDKVYMTYVQAMYGGGGWPLSVFLSPNLKPFMGGTYFPPDDKYGRPGFKTILRKVKDVWDTKKDTLEEGGSHAIEQLSEALSATSVSRRLSEEVLNCSLKNCYEQLAESYDPKFGGFGSAPKFPRPVEIHLMLYWARKMKEIGKESEAIEAEGMAAHTLKCMARGGIHDHIGGGFHRYSVDECWHVPHFEKMLYDQGQLANAYLDAFSVTKDKFYSTMVRDILDYLRRDIIGLDGEIYSAEDADSAEYAGAQRKKEGAFYVWTSEEVEKTVGEGADLFKEHYYIKDSGNCDLSKMSDPHDEFNGKNVLIERKEMSSRASKVGLAVDEYAAGLGAWRKKLFDARLRRPKPHLDDKVIVSWNGLAISAFARASKVIKNEGGEAFYFPVVGCNPSEYLDTAERAASFIRTQLYNEKSHRLTHSFRNGPSKAPGFLDDYAFLIAGLLDLYEFGGNIKWLKWAVDLQATQDELFLDTEGGAYFNTGGEDPSVLLRVKEDYDGAEPSGNSVSAINLIRFSSLFSNSKSDEYHQKAEHLMAVFEDRLKERSIALPLMCCAADMLAVSSQKQVVIAGSNASAEFQDMISTIFSSYDPNRRVIQIDPNNKEEMEFWEEVNSSIAAMAKSSLLVHRPVVAHVCENFVCRAPVSSPQALHDLLN